MLEENHAVGRLYHLGLLLDRGKILYKGTRRLPSENLRLSSPALGGGSADNRGDRRTLKPGLTQQSGDTFDPIGSTGVQSLDPGANLGNL